jgi:hypothetical protein
MLTALMVLILGFVLLALAVTFLVIALQLGAIFFLSVIGLRLISFGLAGVVPGLFFLGLAGWLAYRFWFAVCVQADDKES